jgi:hypothetical protein
MNGYRKKILACAKIALELFAAVAGILAFLLK